VVKALKLQLGDHPYAREVIGERGVIETLTQDQIRAFYDAYYRPERATLIIVGDIEPGTDMFDQVFSCASMVPVCSA